MSLTSRSKSERTRVMTTAQLRRAESNGWRVTEQITHRRGTFVNLVSPGGKPRTVRIFDGAPR